MNDQETLLEVAAQAAALNSCEPCETRKAVGGNRDSIDVLNERDARLEANVVAIVGYKLGRESCPGWLFAGTTPSEVAEALRNELDSHEGLSADECGVITIEAYETTQAEIDALPEFGGW